MSRAAFFVFAAIAFGCAPRARPATRSAWEEAGRACRGGEQAACLWVAVSRENAGDFVEAAQLLERACEAGVADACAEFAFLLEKGRGVSRDLARAVKLDQRACEAGSAQGCHSLGVAYFRELGVARDLVRSTQLYERACAGGHAAACRDLGIALAEGRAGKKDLARARTLWRNTCPKEDVSCTKLAHSLYVEDRDQAIAVAKEGCRAGGRDSCYLTGIWFEKQANPQLAARYLRTGCAWGDEWSCAAFGSLMEKFWSADPEGGRIWAESCARGFEESCHRIARYKVEHKGNREAAHAEFERLCRGGYGPSCKWLCLDEKGWPAKPPCEAACALGAKDQCPARDAGEPEPPVPPAP